MTSWFDWSCYGNGFYRDREDWLPHMVRDEFSDRIHIGGRLESPYPFCHATESPEWLEHSWEMDKLILPVVEAMQDSGIRTRSSCQGSYKHSPAVLFEVPDQGLKFAKEFFVWGVDMLNRPATDRVMVTLLEDRRFDGGIALVASFYDQITLMDWVQTKFGISIARQCQKTNISRWNGPVIDPDEVERVLAVQPLWRHHLDKSNPMSQHTQWLLREEQAA